MTDEVRLSDIGVVTRSIAFGGGDCATTITRGHEHDVTVIRERLLGDTIPECISMVESRAKICRVFSHMIESGIPDGLLTSG